MNTLEEKSNNEILLEIKQYQQDHESLKMAMLKDYDSIEALKIKMKRDFLKLEAVEKKFDEANQIIVRRLKGNV